MLGQLMERAVLQAVQDGEVVRAAWSAQAALALSSCPAQWALLLQLQEGEEVPFQQPLDLIPLLVGSPTLTPVRPEAMCLQKPQGAALADSVLTETLAEAEVPMLGADRLQLQEDRARTPVPIGMGTA